MKNTYLKHAHISQRKFKQVLVCFCNDYTAKATAEIVGISRNTVNSLYARIRLRLLELGKSGQDLDGEVEVDESYFGARNGQRQTR